MSLIAFLIACVVAYCEVSIARLQCGVVKWGSCNRNPPVGSFVGSCMLREPFAFSPGCAHQGRGPEYSQKTEVSTKNCMTSIVADTGHSTSCGKPLNWTQLVSSISFQLSLPLVSILCSYLLSLFPHVFTELQSYSGTDRKIPTFFSELLGQDFSVRNHFVMEFNFIY